MDVAGLLRKSAERTGFIRESYNESQIPTDSSRITVVPFFGDLRSLFILSSLLLNRFREEERASRYFILCSWPGFSSLFPYVDEYWGVEDESVLEKMYSEATQFRNKSELASGYYRSINQYFFEDVVIPSEYFKEVYGKGLQNAFWKRYKEIRRSLPSVPSSSTLGKEFNRSLATKGGFKVFIYPALYTYSYKLGDIHPNKTNRNFWISLVRTLIKNGFTPVVYKGYLTHDLSSDLVNECIQFTSKDFGQVLSAMRATGCVLDVFSGISRMAIAARCPFLMVDERSRYSGFREYEIDDLCANSLPRNYIFSFSTIINNDEAGNWNFNLFGSILKKLSAFMPDLDRDNWPFTNESTEVVSYNSVRKRRSKSIGTKLIKIPKD